MSEIEKKYINNQCIIKPYKNQKYDSVILFDLEILDKLINYPNFPVKNRFAGIIKIITFLLEQSTRGIVFNEIVPFPIHSKVWSHHFTTSKYKAYQSLLEDLRVIKQVNLKGQYKYLAGKYSMHYMFDDGWFGGELIKLYIRTGRSTVTVKQSSFAFGYWLDEGSEMDEILNYYKVANYDISQIQLDVEKAEKAELEYSLSVKKKKKRALAWRLSMVINFNYRDSFILQGMLGKRLYHKICMLSRVAREFLSDGYGKSYKCLDVKNCQPLLLCAVLYRNNLPFDEKYKNDCESGTFYNSFKYLSSDRDFVKRQIYKTVLFAQKPKRRFNVAFKEIYPITYNSLSIIAEESTSTASLLQMFESHIFNNIKSRDGNKFSFFTLFDAVYYTDKWDKFHFEREITKGFSQFNLVPKIDDKEGENKFNI